MRKKTTRFKELVLTKTVREGLDSDECLDEGSGYIFKHYPFGERGKFIHMNLYDELVDWLESFSELRLLPKKILVSPEPGGLPFAYLAAKALDCTGVLPIRLSDDGDLSAVTNSYSTKRFFCPAAGDGEEVVLFDDVLSSGATLKKLVQIVRENGFVVKHVFIICSRDPSILKTLSKDLEVNLHIYVTENTD